MKQSNLQHLISVNASNIHGLQLYVGFLKDQVKYWDAAVQNATNELDKSEALAAEFAEVVELRKAKKAHARAVEAQKDLKAELAYIHREGRIERGMDRLIDAGIVSLDVGVSNPTSYEVEQAIKAKLKEVFPPKADSRIKAA